VEHLCRQSVTGTGFEMHHRMVRRLFVHIAAVALLAGCQSKSAQMTGHPVAATTLKSTTLRAPAASTAPVREIDAVPAAAALVFDPPVIQDEPPLQLSRADREPRVSLGYEGPIIEYYDIRFDDRQIGYGFQGRFAGSGGRFGASGNFDSYERRAVTERIGVLYR
jgi:hypothetical protein